MYTYIHTTYSIAIVSILIMSMFIHIHNNAMASITKCNTNCNSNSKNCEDTTNHFNHHLLHELEANKHLLIAYHYPIQQIEAERIPLLRGNVSLLISTIHYIVASHYIFPYFTKIARNVVPLVAVKQAQKTLKP